MWGGGGGVDTRSTRSTLKVGLEDNYSVDQDGFGSLKAIAGEGNYK